MIKVLDILADAGYAWMAFERIDGSVGVIDKFLSIDLRIKIPRQRCFYCVHELAVLEST